MSIIDHILGWAFRPRLRSTRRYKAIDARIIYGRSSFWLISSNEVFIPRLDTAKATSMRPSLHMSPLQDIARQLIITLDLTMQAMLYLIGPWLKIPQVYASDAINASIIFERQFTRHNVTILHTYFLFGGGFLAMNGSAAGLLRGGIIPGGLCGGLGADWGLAAF